MTHGAKALSVLRELLGQYCEEAQELLDSAGRGEGRYKGRSREWRDGAVSTQAEWVARLTRHIGLIDTQLAGMEVPHERRLEVVVDNSKAGPGAA